MRQPSSAPAREADLGPAAFADFSFERQSSTPGPKSIFTVACGRQVRFYDGSLTLLKSFDAPATPYSAALSPDGESFVFGGEDFKMYRYRFEDCKEIENCKGHFGPVHCVRFSPDGELYASGSEDGTIRLWQTHLGKDYGLWKVDKSIASSLPMPGLEFPLSSSPSQQEDAAALPPHVITVGVDMSPGTGPKVVTPKSPNAPRMM